MDRDAPMTERETLVAELRGLINDHPMTPHKAPSRSVGQGMGATASGGRGFASEATPPRMTGHAAKRGNKPLQRYPSKPSHHFLSPHKAL